MTDTFDGLMARGRAGRYTRRRLLQRSLVAGTGAVALAALGGALTAPVAAARETTMAGPLDSDIDILNYALTLELLETAAYKAINAAGILSGRAATYFRAFGANEQAHVDAITATIRQLGGTPVQPPASGYNLAAVPRDPVGVVAFFQEFESVGASAYLGAGPFIRDPAILEAALAIHAVEAEHAAALADLVAPGTELFAPEAFATARHPDTVMTIVAPFLQAPTAPTVPAPTPSPSAPPSAPMPGLPNTGGGGAQAASGDPGLRATLAALGLVGLGAATAGTLARRRVERKGNASE
jgi:hypothetical protein